MPLRRKAIQTQSGKTRTQYVNSRDKFLVELIHPIETTPIVYLGDTPCRNLSNRCKPADSHCRRAYRNEVAYNQKIIVSQSLLAFPLLRCKATNVTANATHNTGEGSSYNRRGREGGQRHVAVKTSFTHIPVPSVVLGLTGPRRLSFSPLVWPPVAWLVRLFLPDFSSGSSAACCPCA